MSQQFKHLFTPLQIGSMTVKNRLLTAAHSHDFWKFDPERYYKWNKLGHRAMHYHEERAKGGFGLITTGQAVVHPSCGTTRPAAYLEEIVEEYRPIAEAIHRHGAKVVMQLNHNGRGRTSGTDDWQPTLGTTPGLALYIAGQAPGGEFTKEIEVTEIKEIVQGFAISARNLQRAGWDGVEIQASHSYLVAEFLAPAYNKRTDEYGGTLENRMRFLMEIVDAVRSACGKEFVVGVRHNSEWRMPVGGFSLEESILVAKALEDTGKVDFINVTGWPNLLSMAGQGTPFGVGVANAGAIKRALRKTPVFVVGRIVDPLHAEQVLADGHADMIAMARASIADPELPKKAQEGRLDDIRTCVGASQGCLARHMIMKPMTCTQNPTVGREAEWGTGTLTPAAKKKKVLVVGGGPAGLEAAMVAAQRGHQVELYERGAELGGQVNLIVKNQRRSEFRNVVEWRKTQLGKLGVPVHLHTAVTPELVAERRPDAVIIATGSQPRREAKNGLPDYWTPSRQDGLGIKGADLSHVHTVWDVLQGRLDGARHVVVVDGVGYYQSADVVEHLLARGCTVEAVATGTLFAEDMTSNDRPVFLANMRGKNVSFYQLTTVKEIRANAVSLLDGQSGREFTIDGVDGVVLSMGNAPVNALYYALEGKVSELYRIGDCVSPRRVEHAHFEGHKVARAL